MIYQHHLHLLRYKNLALVSSLREDKHETTNSPLVSGSLLNSFTALSLVTTDTEPSYLLYFIPFLTIDDFVINI